MPIDLKIDLSRNMQKDNREPSSGEIFRDMADLVPHLALTHPGQPTTDELLSLKANGDKAKLMAMFREKLQVCRYNKPSTVEKLTKILCDSGLRRALIRLVETNVGLDLFAVNNMYHMHLCHTADYWNDVLNAQCDFYDRLASGDGSEVLVPPAHFDIHFHDTLAQQFPLDKQKLTEIFWTGKTRKRPLCEISPVLGTMRRPDLLTSLTSDDEYRAVYNRCATLESGCAHHQGRCGTGLTLAW